ncbi:hypothetical protein, partial [Heyndrickxia sporothermodurans]
GMYLAASEVTSARAEALHGVSRLCRRSGRYEIGLEYARRGLGIQPPEDGLFVEPWVYEYGLLDEFAINAYWAGRYRESLDASIKLLASGSAPGERSRFAANARAALDRLPQDANLGSRSSSGLVEQHTLLPARTLQSELYNGPRVLVAILAKQKEASLPLYLECIDALDYPKSLIVLYVRTNNNTDATEQILRDWVARVGDQYAAVEFDAGDVADRVEQFAVHEWNATRFRVLAQIRNHSLRLTKKYECGFYFVADVDNFIRPNTLRELLSLNLPIVAPLLRSIVPGAYYSNFHAEVDDRGYYRECDQYHWVLNRWLVGLLEMPVVHCTYLVRSSVLDALTYEDESGRHEYVVFSESARKAEIPQYLDNRQVYGYVTFDESDPQYVEGGIEEARRLLGAVGVGNGHGDLALAAPQQTRVEEHIKQKFGSIYETNEWGFGSGVGSLPENNADYIKYVETFIKAHSVRSVVDFGCGDWQFSRFINWQGANYVGFDLVTSVINRNCSEFARPGIAFRT